MIAKLGPTYRDALTEVTDAFNRHGFTFACRVAVLHKRLSGFADLVREVNTLNPPVSNTDRSET